MMQDVLFDGDELIALAQLDLNAGRLGEALAKLKTVRQLGTACPDVALALLAKVYAQLQLFDRAKELFGMYVDKNPGAINERFQHGMTFLDSGEPTGALAIWQRLLKDQPGHPPCLYFSAIAHLDLQQIREARRVLEFLLQTVSADNLYFGRAKELIIDLDRSGAAARGPDAGDVYRTSH